MMKTKTLAIIWLLILTDSALAVELPVVPVSVMSTQNSSPETTTPGTPVSTDSPIIAPPRQARPFVPDASGTSSAMAAPTSSEPRAPALKVTNEKSDIVISPGVTEIVPVALGQLNRVVTPFEHPELKTTSQAATRIDDSVVYLAPKSEAPVGLYITEKGDESTALSITMIPKRIPPREIRLHLSGGGGGALAAANIKARHWEESYPYEETLRNLLRTVAEERLPPGYSITAGVSPSHRSCRSQEARRARILYDFEHGQTLTGDNFDVVIGLVHNVGNAPVELKETWCANSVDVAAVAYWPEVVLEPNKATEVYVVLRHDAPAARAVTRPSLLETAP